VFGDQPPFELVVVLQPAAALAQALSAVADDRLGVRLAFGVERLLGLAQALATIPGDPQLDR
jgi:hypothetical protein